MIWAHFRAFFWLRWRLRANYWKRLGWNLAALRIVIGLLVALAALSALAMGLLLGGFSLEAASPTDLMYGCDVAVAVFMFFWIGSLLAELQRSESLSLDKLLHLPVSMGSAFAINYLSSLLNLTLLMVVPAAFGISLGLAVARGPAMLLLVPLVVAFLLMVTALTYQFQGWLASLMVNRRRRRAIIAGLTMTFVLLAQLPNLLNMYSRHGAGGEPPPEPMSPRVIADGPEQDAAAEQASQQQWLTDQREQLAKAAEARQQRSDERVRAVALANLVLPPGWLPLGVRAVAAGRWLPAIWGILGMAAIGGLSLCRSYRTTLQIYTGAFTARGKPRAVAPAQTAPPARSRLLERQFRWVPEPAAVVALATFRSLARAREVRMALLGSVVILFVFGGSLARGAASSPHFRPLLAFAVMAILLMGVSQLANNLFGLDRGGFQTLVLSPARRRDILLGKNLALAPMVLGIALVVVAVGQWFVPMGWDYALAVPLEFVSMYLVYCLLANWLSILAPVRIPPGALRGSKPGALTVIIQLMFMLLLLPAAMSPLLLPLAVKELAFYWGLAQGWPLCFLLTVLELAAVVGIYYFVLGRQGRLLQAREQKILDTVRAQPE